MARDFDLQFPKTHLKEMRRVSGVSPDFDVWWKMPQDLKGVSCPACGFIQSEAYQVGTPVTHTCVACKRINKIVLKDSASAEARPEGKSLWHRVKGFFQ